MLMLNLHPKTYMNNTYGHSYYNAKPVHAHSNELGMRYVLIFRDMYFLCHKCVFGHIASINIIFVASSDKLDVCTSACTIEYQSRNVPTQKQLLYTFIKNHGFLHIPSAVTQKLEEYTTAGIYYNNNISTSMMLLMRIFILALLLFRKG
jgi:hypothetical protein